MKVEIWAGVTRPWRGLGSSHRLNRAVRRFEHGATPSTAPKP